MQRISAMFVAICMAVIAGSLGAVLFLAFEVSLVNAALVSLAVLTALGLYNTITNRVRDRHDLGDQIADLSRGTADLARQVGELARRISAMEGKVDTGVSKARGAVDPLAAEIGELGGLVQRLAETVAAHEAELQTRGESSSAYASDRTSPAAAPLPAAPAPTNSSWYEPPAVVHATELGEPDAKFFATGKGRFGGMTRDNIIALISGAVEASRIDLYLQPIVTLPQRKVRYYESLSRLRTDEGDVVAADDFLEYAESGGLMPKIDNMLLFRCVQVMRRLLLKNRDVGLFCNVSMATLNDPIYFRQFLDFMIANKALAPSLVFEFRQVAYRSLGPAENEALSSLAEHGFRFSMDHLTDLRMEPKELADRGFRFLKVPAKLLLNRATGAQSDIDPADLADLLARSGIDLIAERIESEPTVIELLDFDVKFGQGFLFSPPRPVRPEALQSGGTSFTPSDTDETVDRAEASPAA